MFAQAMEFVSGIFEPATKLIDDVHTSTEEKLQLKNALVSMQNEVSKGHIGLLSKQMDLEKQLLEAQSSVITAEAKSESIIAKNWRPVTMLTFVGIIYKNCTHYLGIGIIHG